MTLPMIPQAQLIPDGKIGTDADYGGLKIVRYQTDQNARETYQANRFEFQHEQARRNTIPGVVLSRSGADPLHRITAMMHLSLRQFIEFVHYDPSNPPMEDFEALGMKDAHDQTQQDFRGAKKDNLANYKQYLIEAIRGDRVAYLPPVTGWQSPATFDETIFVALDESNPAALYGVLYLPKKPIMQADGQTQTAALFQAARTGLAIKSGALDSFGITMEVELKVDIQAAGQSFADRNGRGSKKNKNLVAQLDNSSALAQIRYKAIQGTVFEGRLADGRTGGATETATKNIVDLSTLDQMLLQVISRGTKKAEHIKHYHIEHLLPYCREFIELLDSTFASQWADPTPRNSEPYRRLYVHGWAFALKAMAMAFHDCHRDKVAPLSQPIGTAVEGEHATTAEAEAAYLAAIQDLNAEAPESALAPAEYAMRLRKIDWHRYRQHWIAITGFKLDRKTGKKKTREINDGDGSKLKIVEGKAENTAATIGNVANKILSPRWVELTSAVNAK
ncbi:DNA sulfur modification protein DndB [Amycolatopsis japonica]